MADMTVPIALVVAALAILVPLVRGSHRDDVTDRETRARQERERDERRAQLDREAAEIRGQILARLGHIEAAVGDLRTDLADLRDVQRACQEAHQADSDQLRSMILGPLQVV